MHPGIATCYEYARGCGFRSPLRMYLVCDGPALGCGKIPVPLGTCPCCGMGIKPSRAPQWLEKPELLWSGMVCKAKEGICMCPLSDGYKMGPALLIWVGEKYYKTPQVFTQESKFMGISRHIKHIPRGFVLGKTWVLLAHRKGIDIAPIFASEAIYQGAIFAIFKPQRIEIVVAGDEPDVVIDNYIERGLTPVIVKNKLPDADRIPEKQISFL